MAKTAYYEGKRRPRRRQLTAVDFQEFSSILAGA